MVELEVHRRVLKEPLILNLHVTSLSLASQTQGCGFSLCAMAMCAGSMLEYWTRDQEALAGLRGPWFPPLSSSPGPVNLQLMAISEHEFRRTEQAPVNMTLHHVTKNGTRVEYLVRLVAMTIVDDWTQNSGPLLSPELIHEGDGHES